MDIGRSIKVAMAQRGWKNKDLAEKLGVTDAAVSSLVRCQECSGSRLRSLSKTFDIKASELVALGE